MVRHASEGVKGLRWCRTLILFLEARHPGMRQGVNLSAPTD